MRKNKFSFVVLLLSVLEISVSAQEIKSVNSINQLLGKKVACKQTSRLLFQPKQIIQPQPIDDFRMSGLAQTNSNIPVGFAFVMPQPILAFQIEPMLMDGTGKKDRKIDWVCVAVCLALIPNPLTCADLCVMN